MLNISETKDYKLIKSIVTNEKLWELSGFTSNTEEYRPNLNNIWLEIKKDGKVTGLLELRHFTTIAYEGHIYIIPEYQNRILAREAVEQARNYIKKYFVIRTVFVPVPLQCVHVFKFLNKVPNILITGFIKDGIIYKGLLQDIIIYSLKI